MGLGAKQELFSRLVVKLMTYAHDNGYEIRMGEVWRPQVTANYYASKGLGVRKSAHCNKLAIDINLFKDGEWLTRTSDYAELGEYWKSLHWKCRWGGDFKRRDAFHFSFVHLAIY